MDRTNFIYWAYKFLDHVQDRTAHRRKVLLVYDGYRSHLSLDVLDILAKHSAIVYALPAYTSGKTQPCDTVLFGSFKHHLDAALCDCVLARPDHTFDPFDFCEVLKFAYNASVTPQNIWASFRRAGLWPVDHTRILEVPRPATADARAPIRSAAELEEQFRKKLQEVRSTLLGSDTILTARGYVDTTNGCVITAPQTLDIVRKKEELNARKRRAKAVKVLKVSLAREVKRQTKSRPREKRGAMERGAADSGFGNGGAGSIGIGVERNRSLLERRFVAKIRKLHATPLVFIGRFIGGVEDEQAE